MNCIATKIEGLATFGANEVEIRVGPDSVPVTFVRAGDNLWLADCLTPGCRGLIETDSPDYASAICSGCEDRLDSEAVQAPAVPKAHSPIPAPRPPQSLIPVAAAPVLTIVQPPPVLRPLFGHQKCKRCSRYMTPDNSSGHMGTTCGTCRDESGVNRKTTNCESCGSNISHLNCARRFCVECNRKRNAGSSRERSKARKIVGMGIAETVHESAECAEDGISSTMPTNFDTTRQSNTVNVVNS